MIKATNKIYVLSNSESVQCNFYIFDHATFIQFETAAVYKISSKSDDFYRVSAHVRLSVRLSVTFRYQIKTAQHIVIDFSPYVSPIILDLSASNIFTKFRRGHPLRGAKYRWGIKISRFWTNNSLYLVKRHSYYGIECLCDLSTGAISNYLERTLTLFSRLHHSLTLNISQTAIQIRP